LEKEKAEKSKLTDTIKLLEMDKNSKVEAKEIKIDPTPMPAAETVVDNKSEELIKKLTDENAALMVKLKTLDRISEESSK